MIKKLNPVPVDFQDLGEVVYEETGRLVQDPMGRKYLISNHENESYVNLSLRELTEDDIKKINCRKK